MDSDDDQCGHYCSIAASLCEFVAKRTDVQFSHNICTDEKVDIKQSLNLKHLFMLSVTLCPKFCRRRTTFDKVTVKTFKIPMDPSSQT